jgi:hypothetical protein
MSMVNFAPPTLRSAMSDLAISVSPLGLVELADEEFEVHGPRMNRYASNWAWYLGHHWAFRRAAGEPQLTFNYVKAFADYITNFTFGRGVEFHSPEATSLVIPPLLKRVWEIDNSKNQLLWEMGQLGGVSGDVFLKVAYEEAWVDPSGMIHPGRIRILPLNPAFCFPEFHPHDRTRMIRFKLKYKFWGTAQDGTRQVYTYVELLTDESIEEYINDELIRRDPNLLGEIPIVHVPNIMVASSPWGLGDITDIISLNREYNEKATELSDIINYHSQPVTVIIGAKAANLEKGPKKVWTIGNEKAKIENLELETNFAGPLGFMELLKRAMHEMTGVPEGALGQQTPISNTSGVALQMQYSSMMHRYHQKRTQYTVGLKRVNALVIKTAAVFEPSALYYNPQLAAVVPDPDQLTQLDPYDPVTYRTDIFWPDPMPMDRLLKINEIQALMAMSLESRKGAMRDLGVQYPDQKLREVFEEMMEDMKEQGALDLVRMQIAQFQMQSTGMTPDGQPILTPEGGMMGASPIDPELAKEMMERAYAPMPPQTMDYEANDQTEQ